MTRILRVALLSFAFVGASTVQHGSTAQVVQRSQVALDNQTSAPADLYVDGAYACRALARLMCVTQVTPGDHGLSASGYSRRISVEAGAVFTWRIPD